MRKLNIEEEVFTDYAERIVYNEPFLYDNTERVLLIDFDSALYESSYMLPGISEEEDIVEAKFRLSKKLQEIVINVEKWYNIKGVFIFVGGKDNIRYTWFSQYKANRPPKIPLIDILKEYAINELNAYPSHGFEADDYIYTAYLQSKGNCVCSFIDKDLKGFIHSVPIYNYKSWKDKKGEWESNTEVESLYKRRIQLLTGDSSDNIKTNKGFGEVSAKKLIKLNMSHYSFKKIIVNTYKKYNGINWREEFNRVKKLIYLYDIRK